MSKYFDAPFMVLLPACSWGLAGLIQQMIVLYNKDNPTRRFLKMELSQPHGHFGSILELHFQDDSHEKSSGKAMKMEMISRDRVPKHFDGEVYHLRKLAGYKVSMSHWVPEDAVILVWYE